MTMKVLIPACNMESRLRNKYLFFFFFKGLADIGVFWRGVGGPAGVCGSWGCSLWGGYSFVHAERVCVRTHGGFVVGGACQPAPLGSVQLWLRTSGCACLVRLSGTRPLRPHPPCGTRVGLFRVPTCLWARPELRTPVTCVSFTRAGGCARMCFGLGDARPK